MAMESVPILVKAKMSLTWAWLALWQQLRMVFALMGECVNLNHAVDPEKRGVWCALVPPLVPSAV